MKLEKLVLVIGTLIATQSAVAKYHSTPKIANGRGFSCSLTLSQLLNQDGISNCHPNIVEKKVRDMGVIGGISHIFEELTTDSQNCIQGQASLANEKAVFSGDLNALAGKISGENLKQSFFASSGDLPESTRIDNVLTFHYGIAIEKNAETERKLVFAPALAQKISTISLVYNHQQKNLSVSYVDGQGVEMVQTLPADYTQGVRRVVQNFSDLNLGRIAEASEINVSAQLSCGALIQDEGR